MIYKKINLKHHYVALSISIFILFFILEFTSIDFFIQNKFFDFSSNIFIAGNYPFIENYLHKGLKNVMYAEDSAPSYGFTSRLKNRMTSLSRMPISLPY